MHEIIIMYGLHIGLHDCNIKGKPRISWEENAKNWTGLKLQECTRMAEDKVKWRDDAINL